VYEELGIAVEYIDLGGGFASQNTLLGSYTPGEFASPSLEQYAAAIGEAFNESPFAAQHKPMLILETGRALIDEAGSTLSTVLAKKNLPTGERAVILDAGVNTTHYRMVVQAEGKPYPSFPGAYQNTVFMDRYV